MLGSSGPPLSARFRGDSWPAPAVPAGSLRLKLDHRPVEGEKLVSRDLSAIAVVGESLFLSGDESAHIEVLDRLSSKLWSEHRRIHLGEIFELPDPSDEMDIEGLAISDGWLWVVGSHSRTRCKPPKGKPVDAEALERLAELKDNPNRFFLGRVPLAPLKPGSPRYGLAGYDAPPDGRKPGMLSIKKRGDALARRLRKDPHFAPFLKLPAKENGLDIEGIVVDGARVAVGLRGPVINGWACVLEFTIRETKSGQLKIDGELEKRWLKLDGLGIRDMKRDGDDILILAGPTMALDGPALVYRWRGWARGADAGVAPIRPQRLLDLPYGHDCDHPEAISPWPTPAGPGLLIVCDSPASRRMVAGGLTADLFAL